MRTPRPTPRLALASVAAQAIREHRLAVARSFRFRRPRGPMCARGYCSQCEVTTPEGRTLACQTPPGLRPPTPPTDPLRPLGKVAELFRPWFWERRFLRPRRLRGLFLHALRFLSSAGALGEHAPAGRVRRYEEIEAAVVVVGSDRSHGDAFVVDVENGDVPLGVYPDRTLGLLRGDRLISVRFQKLVLATGSYERLPPIPGSDLPGVLGVDAAEIYGAQGALEAGLRIAGWAPQDQHARIEALAQRHGLRVVWTDVRAPREIHGRRRVEAVVAERRIDCDLFVVGVRQPAIELAMQAGATAELTSGELPILALTSTPDWLEVTGDAARTSSDVPDVAPAARAIVCLCEDVRVSDLEACAAQGFTQTELVKRRTGAMTGPCQGKLCSASVLATLRRLGVDPTPTRSRPLLRPVTLGDLAADA